MNTRNALIVAAVSALIINLSRQGFVYIPCLYIFTSLFGITYRKMKSRS